MHCIWLDMCTWDSPLCSEVQRRGGFRTDCCSGPTRRWWCWSGWWGDEWQQGYRHQKGSSHSQTAFVPGLAQADAVRALADVTQASNGQRQAHPGSRQGQNQWHNLQQRGPSERWPSSRWSPAAAATGWKRPWRSVACCPLCPGAAAWTVNTQH